MFDERISFVNYLSYLLITAPMIVLLFYCLPKKLYYSKYFDYVRQHSYLRMAICILYIICMIDIIALYIGVTMFVTVFALPTSGEEILLRCEAQPICFNIVNFFFEMPSWILNHLNIFKYIF